MELEVYHPRRPVDRTKTYKVDVFMRRWVTVGPDVTFIQGGRYFVLSGKNLDVLVKKSPTFDEEVSVYGTSSSTSNKRDVCFLGCLGDRQALIDKYNKLFYSRTTGGLKSETAFKKLCVRPRRNRYANRLTFNYLIVKRLKCDACSNVCVYDALKMFYNMDDKCVAQVDDLVSRECV
ncbi:lef-2 [Clostera anachoreta granulovirus]|uniref:Lef-2 n=1 Tax=Clostera anachoreta granulovirus TaxID=283675 RepID=F4ZKQ6_9BBAC|nr:lef-2 [Clostera anachoreta granulovirus]AEB00317.1 lef-2 [Clostera anachoreta granulovirus]